MSILNTQKDLVQFEPRKINRARVVFGEPFEHIPSMAVHKVSQIVYSGNRTKWEDVIITMYDPVAPSTSKAIIAGIKEWEKNPSKIVKVFITELDPVGVEVGKWELPGAVTKINFGCFDWNQDSPRMVELYFRVYDVKLIM